ncbi:6,7-dimethyl-8-ribityllumazine synthase [Ichthyobacterium seriolicida]|uniref:6,7-dimethyl-8-ribityllumazine synthase n=1 Tax=Ichthyobacterium seriolicida TaxID=242600 RepID=A0A1J1E2J6_9FLAO|nr:6,7-dimethyl-8-ribityllumazine synthase [Ichthyobacterium seriolicida]BAV95173.1 6,7-dimethyl-8-ribityllumazine synthase [Ichthyobacterium seriolicida]
MSTEHRKYGSIIDNISKEDISEMSFGLVVSQWNSQITENLYNGANETLLSSGVDEGNIFRLNVPGSFELIYGSKLLYESNTSIDAIISIGSLIEGETKHFDYICQAVSNGIKDLNIKYSIPFIFCVLTDNNIEQSIARSGGKLGNKGIESAICAMDMAVLNRRKLSK